MAEAGKHGLGQRCHALGRCSFFAEPELDPFTSTNEGGEYTCGLAAQAAAVPAALQRGAGIGAAAESEAAPERTTDLEHQLGARSIAERIDREAMPRWQQISQLDLTQQCERERHHDYVGFDLGAATVAYEREPPGVGAAAHAHQTAAGLDARLDGARQAG